MIRSELRSDDVLLSDDALDRVAGGVDPVTVAWVAAGAVLLGGAAVLSYQLYQFGQNAQYPVVPEEGSNQTDDKKPRK